MKITVPCVDELAFVQITEDGSTEFANASVHLETTTA